MCNHFSLLIYCESRYDFWFIDYSFFPNCSTFWIHILFSYFSARFSNILNDIKNLYNHNFTKNQKFLISLCFSLPQIIIEICDVENVLWMLHLLLDLLAEFVFNGMNINFTSLSSSSYCIKYYGKCNCQWKVQFLNLNFIFHNISHS